MTTTPPQPRQFKILASGFDPGRTRCAAESRLWAAIEQSHEFHKRITEEVAQRQGSLVQGKLNLRTESYLVDPQITPQLDQLIQTLRQVLRVLQPIDVFVVSSPALNAFCLPSRKQSRFLMGLHSSLFHLFTANELLFVMGHELGHALLSHARVPNIGFDHPDFSPLEVFRLRALERRQEISCDRVGLLACQDVRVAASALFKLMCGLPPSWLRSFDEEAFAKHFDKIIDMVDYAPDLEDPTGTHPIIPLRVKALLGFSKSTLYAEALGLARAEVSTDELEKATEYLLSVLEPDLSGLETASEEEAANRFMVRGAMVVAASDGVLEPAEIAFLRAKLPIGEGLAEKVAAPDFIPRTLAEMAEDAQVLQKKLSLTNRAGLLHMLTLVAMSAGGFVDAEQEVLIEIAKMLDLSEDDYRGVVGAAGSEASEATPESEASPAPKKTRRRKPAKAEAVPEATPSKPPPGSTSGA